MNFGASIFCCDLETFTEESEYCKRYHQKKTNVYAIAIQRIPIHWTAKTDWIENKYVHGHNTLKMFGTFEKLFEYLNDPKTHGTNIYVYFHNGQKFDYYFLLSWFQKHFKFISNYAGLKLEEVCYDMNGQDFFMFDKSDGWFSLSCYLWNDAYQRHVWIEFRDSMKLLNGSIERWSNDLLNNQHGTFKELLYRDRWAWSSKNGMYYDLIDLNKKPLEIDYVTDLKNGTAYTKDGKSYLVNDVTQWPDMIRERVGNDVLIMVYAIKYMLISHLINIPHSSTVCVSMGQYSIKSYVNERLQDEVFRKSVTTNGKVDDDKLWNLIYGCTQEQRDECAFALHGFIRGGICTLHPNFINKIVKGDFISLDVNSEYPFIATNDLPSGPVTKTNTIPTDNSLYYFVEFEFKSVKQLLLNATPIIPVKWASEDIEDNNLHYVFSLKNGKSYVGQEEWKVLQNKHWFKFTGLKIINVYTFQKNNYLKDYMLHNNEVKIHSEGIARLGAKTKSNSITGKLSQKPLRAHSINPKWLHEQGISVEQVHGRFNDEVNDLIIDRWNRCCATGENMVLYEYAPASFGYIPGYCAITSGGRAWLIQHMFEICEAFPDVTCLYNDTDSIKFKVKDYGKVMNWLCEHDWLNDKELGKFKEEFHQEIKQMKIIAPKKYLTADAKGIINVKKSALSGVKWKQVYSSLDTNEPRINQIKGNSIFKVLKPFKVDGGVILKETELALNEIKVRN